MRIELFAIVLVSCGQIDGPVDAGIDGQMDASTDASTQCSHIGTFPSCNTLQPSPAVIITCTSSPPAPLGGTLLDGTYNLVKAEWDQTANSCPAQPGTRRGSIELCGDTILWIDSDPALGTTSSVDAKITLQGTAMTFADFCTDTQALKFDYSASGDQFVLFYLNPNTGLRLIFTFQRQ